LLKALRGVRARMSKYNEALKKKTMPDKKEQMKVGTLDDDKKDVSRYQSPERSTKKKHRVPAGMIGSISLDRFAAFENLGGANKSKEERDQEENEAKDEIGKLLDGKIESKSTTSTKALAFTTIRNRYIKAIDECRPQTLDHDSFPNLADKEEVLKKRREKRKQCVAKKEEFVRI
jgi:hypothetical protein